MTQRWDRNKNCDVVNVEVNQFLEELKALYEKHRMWLGFSIDEQLTVFRLKSEYEKIEFDNVEIDLE